MAPALTPTDLKRAIHDNLRNLGVAALDVVNLRVGGFFGPSEGSIEEPFATLADLQQQGLIRKLGLSNVTPTNLNRRAASRRLSACRITTTSSIETMTR